MELYKKISQTIGVLTMLFAPVYFLVSLFRLSGRPFESLFVVVIVSLGILWSGWTAVILGEIIENGQDNGATEDLRRQIAELRKRIIELEKKT